MASIEALPVLEPTQVPEPVAPKEAQEVAP